MRRAWKRQEALRGVGSRPRSLRARASWQCTAGSRTTADERGSGTLLMVAVMLVVTVVGLTVSVGLGYVVGAHRVRVAADLAALSGAAAVHMGEDACAAARRIAMRNNARLTACTVLGDQIEFLVQVSVVVDVPHPPVGLPERLATSAQAGVLQSGGR